MRAASSRWLSPAASRALRTCSENSLAGGRAEDQTDFVMLVGPDQSGNLIEVGIVVTDDIEYAIHAMRARNQYLEWL